MRAGPSLIVAVLTVAVLAAAAPGQVIINMPPPPGPSAADDQVGVGTVALTRYAYARRWPRQTWFAPPTPWPYRSYGYWPFPYFGYPHIRPYFRPYYGWPAFGFWPYSGWGFRRYHFNSWRSVGYASGFQWR